MADLNKLLARANELIKTRATTEKRLETVTRRIKDAVRPAVEACNLDDSLVFIIVDYRILFHGGILTVQARSLKWRDGGYFVCGESVGDEANPFREKAREIFNKTLKVPVMVEIDHEFYGK
jgi:hypothetical protein